jgi:hypothetical protein
MITGKETIQGTIMDAIKAGQDLSEEQKQYLQRAIDNTDCNLQIKVSRCDLKDFKSYFGDNGNRYPTGLLILSDTEVVYFTIEIDNDAADGE